MDIHKATEQAYKNGYAKGYADGKAEKVQGRWQERKFICMDNEIKLGYRCTRCMTTWDAETDYCPNCGAEMRGADNG